MKKIFFLLLFSFLSLHMFASGHGLNAVGIFFEFVVYGFLFLAAFVALTVLNAFNSSRPRRTRTDIYLVLLILFSIIFLYFFITIGTGAIKHGGTVLGLLISHTLIFAVLVILNSVFIASAKKKLKQNLPHW